MFNELGKRNIKQPVNKEYEFYRIDTEYESINFLSQSMFTSIQPQESIDKDLRNLASL